VTCVSELELLFSSTIHPRAFRAISLGAQLFYSVQYIAWLGSSYYAVIAGRITMRLFRFSFCSALACLSTFTHGQVALDPNLARITGIESASVPSSVCGYIRGDYSQSENLKDLGKRPYHQRIPDCLFFWIFMLAIWRISWSIQLLRFKEMLQRLHPVFWNSRYWFLFNLLWI
jgi:hypothetical protein